MVTDASGRGDAVGTTYAVRRGPAVAHTKVLKAAPQSRYQSKTDAYLGLRFEFLARLVPEKGGTRLELEAHTHWPRGMKLLGRVIQTVVFSAHEGRREMEQQKCLSTRGRAEAPETERLVDPRGFEPLTFWMPCRLTVHHSPPESFSSSDLTLPVAD